MQEAVSVLGSNLFGSPKCHSIDYVIPVIRHGHINFHKIPNICNWYKKLKDSNSYSSYPLPFPISEQKYSVRYNLGEQYEMWVNLANAQFERSCSSPFGLSWLPIWKLGAGQAEDLLKNLLKMLRKMSIFHQKMRGWRFCPLVFIPHCLNVLR